MREQWQLHCTHQSSWVNTVEWACVLYGHHIQNDWVKLQICITFCIKLKHSSVETIWIIQKATPKGNFITSMWPLMHHISYRFSGKTSNQSSRWLSPPIVQVWRPVTSGFFPKLKSPLKGKRFQMTVNEIQENRTGQLIAIGRTVWGPKVPTLKGTEMSLSYVSCFLYLLQ